MNKEFFLAKELPMLKIILTNAEQDYYYRLKKNKPVDEVIENIKNIKLAIKEKTKL